MVTVKQVKDVLEEMTTIYAYKDECTGFDFLDNSIRLDRSIVNITTIDEGTGIRINMQKSAEGDNK